MSSEQAATATAGAGAGAGAGAFQLSEKAFDDAFNDVWANNANAISHCYSNTDALKVDFTRTGKRSFLGMINDATNSVYRMVQGAVTDFFRQTVLDFVYGYTGLSGLEKYYDQLDSRDPAEVVRLARVRASAIESCKRDLVPEHEQVVGGWTMCSPCEENQIHSSKLEEKVVLLTRKAMYVCSYDFGGETLVRFTKVLLGDIIGIKEGLYIITPSEYHHPEDNWGLLLTYLNDESRVNLSASIKNVSTPSVPAGTSRILALRAISSDETGVSSHQTVAELVRLLEECCRDAGAFEDGLITHDTVQSVAEARANAGLFAPLLEGLKRRLWL